LRNEIGAEASSNANNTTKLRQLPAARLPARIDLRRENG